MNQLAKINKIPLKYVIGMNLTVLVMAITFLSINTVNQTTENRSQAEETVLPPPLAQIIVDPANPPAIIAPQPDWAKIGDAVLITGKNLGNQPFGSIYLGDIKVPPENIIEWTPDHLVLTVPNQAVTNPITLVFNGDQILSTKIPLRIVDINEPGL